MKFLLFTCFALAGLAPLAAQASDDQDFLIVDSPGGPTTGNLYLVLDGRRSFADDRAAQVGPSLLYGLNDRVAFQLGGEYGRSADEGWHYAGTTPSVQFTLTDPNADGPQVGLTLSHTFAPANGDGSEARLGVQVGPDDNLFAANLFVTHDDDGSDTGAALGYRRGLGDRLAVAVEGEGSLQRADGAQILASLHYDPGPSTGFKFAVGGERGADGYDPFVQVRVYIRLAGN